MLPKIHDFTQIQHDIPWDPSYGYTLADLYAGKGGALMEGQEPPADFEEFWNGTYCEQAAIPPKIIETRPSPFQALSDSYIIEEVYWNVIDGWRVGGWLARPRNAEHLDRLQVLGHGYGGRSEIDASMLDGRRAMLWVCAPGFNLSVDSKRVVSNNSAFHVINGIESSQTYIIRACVAAHWGAGRILQNFYPGVPMIYDGTSFGGGLGAMILAWGDVFAGGYVGQPTFANHPFRLQNETRGSASAVRAVWLKASAEKKAQIERTLSYYETVFHARRISVPVVFCLSVFDPAVPAAGQFSVALNVPKRQRRICPTTVGHFECSHPLEKLECRRVEKARQWLWAQLAKG